MMGNIETDLRVQPSGDTKHGTLPYLVSEPGNQTGDPPRPLVQRGNGFNPDKPQVGPRVSRQELFTADPVLRVRQNPYLMMFREMPGPVPSGSRFGAPAWTGRVSNQKNPHQKPSLIPPDRARFASSPRFGQSFTRKNAEPHQTFLSHLRQHSIIFRLVPFDPFEKRRIALNIVGNESSGPSQKGCHELKLPLHVSKRSILGT